MKAGKLASSQKRRLAEISISRNLKGAHVGVGCDCGDHHHRQGAPFINQEKLICYLVLDIADISSSGLCGVDPETID